MIGRWRIEKHLKCLYCTTKFDIAQCSRVRVKGFTLVELMITLVLLTLLTLGVQIVLTGPLQKARYRNSIEKFRIADGQIRLTCQRQGISAKLVLDTSGEAVVWEFEGKESSTRTISLVGLLEIRSSRGIHRKFTTVLDRLGRSESFAIRIGNTKQGRWLLCAGVTGQILEMEDEAEIEAILSQLTPSDHTY